MSVWSSLSSVASQFLLQCSALQPTEIPSLLSSRSIFPEVQASSCLSSVFCFLYGIISSSQVLTWPSGGTEVCCCNCTWLVTEVNSENKSSNFVCCEFWEIILQVLNYSWIFDMLKEFLCLLTCAKCSLIASPNSSIYSQEYLNWGSFSCTAISVRAGVKKNTFNTETGGSSPPCFLPLGCLQLLSTYSIPRCFDNISADKYQQYINK